MLTFDTNGINWDSFICLQDTVTVPFSVEAASWIFHELAAVFNYTGYSIAYTPFAMIFLTSVM